MAKKSTDTLQAFDEQLSCFEETLSKERDRYAAKIREIDTTLKQVRAKLNAGRKTGSDKTRKAALTQDDTIAATISVLETTGSLPVEQLKERVGERLRSAHSLSGFVLRFKEAMQNDRFTVDESGVRLSDRNHQAERRVAQ